MPNQSTQNRRWPLGKKFWRGVTPTSGCWEWAGARSNEGYGQLRNGQRGSLQAHRVSWTIHFGEIPDGMFVLHHCDNRPCVRPDHLFLGTQADNLHDMYSKGRGRYGGYTATRATAFKLRLRETGQSVREAAAANGISRTTAYRWLALDDS